MYAYFRRILYNQKKTPNRKRARGLERELILKSLTFQNRRFNRISISAYIIQLVQLSFRTQWLKLLDRILIQWLHEVESNRQRHYREWAEWYKRLHRTISIELIRLDIHHLIEWSCFILSILFNLRDQNRVVGEKKEKTSTKCLDFKKEHILLFEVDLGNKQYTCV